MSSGKILIADDDRNVHESLGIYLKSEGFETVDVYDGAAAVSALDGDISLCVMDIMMPIMNGIDACKEIRKNSQVPIIMLTAKGEEIDRILGLELGADDYIVKPFAFEELLARIRCVLRRPVSLQNDELLSFGDIAYEPRTLTLRRGEQSTVLSKRLGDLLELFLRNPGQTLPRETILLRVWGMDCDVEDGNLDNYTYFLRRSLRKVGSCLQLATVRGVGYRLEERHG